MDLAHLTDALLISVVCVLIGYDVWVKIKQPDGNATISWVLLTSSKRFPVIAFAIGFVMGHVFFQNCASP